MSFEWDEPRMELLKRLWISGETARTIAERLGGGLTRNAVIGKAHRLGLTGKHGSKGAASRRTRTLTSKTRNQKPQRKPRLKNRAR
jgi:hypothetical protein